MSAQNFTEKCMQQVYSDAPMLETLNDTYGDLMLSDYINLVKETFVCKGNTGLDPDIEEAIRDYATELIGPEETDECIHVLGSTGLLHTANHHVVNFHPMMVQGNLLYEYLVNLCIDTDTIPFFGCSIVPMSNAFYPRGMLVYDTLDGHECSIPVFPYSMRKVSVSHAPVFTGEMLERAEDSISKYHLSGRISSRTAETLEDVLENVYRETHIGACKRYGEQVMLANRILSAGYQKDKASRHIFLELEEVSRRLLCHDLEDGTSMLNRLLWAPERLDILKRYLDGVSGCWSVTGAGTFLFWGVDPKGRLFRLSHTSGSTHSARLDFSGVDYDGNTHDFHLDPYKLSEALRDRRLLPGLFMTFFSLGIARKNCLVGGCFQGEYLKKMSEGVSVAFAGSGSISGEKDLPLSDPSENDRFPYLCGPLFLTGTDRGFHYPLSTIELWEDPLSYGKLKESLEIPFKRAQEIGLFCFYPDSVPVYSRADNWWKRISEELFSSK